MEGEVPFVRTHHQTEAEHDQEGGDQTERREHDAAQEQIDPCDVTNEIIAQAESVLNTD